jgi:hypothetical protein
MRTFGTVGIQGIVETLGTLLASLEAALSVINKITVYTVSTVSTVSRIPFVPARARHIRIDYGCRRSDIEHRRAHFTAKLSGTKKAVVGTTGHWPQCHLVQISNLVYKYIKASSGEQR